MPVSSADCDSTLLVWRGMPKRPKLPSPDCCRSKCPLLCAKLPARLPERARLPACARLPPRPRPPMFTATCSEPGAICRLRECRGVVVSSAPACSAVGETERQWCGRGQLGTTPICFLPIRGFSDHPNHQSKHSISLACAACLSKRSEGRAQ